MMGRQTPGTEARVKRFLISTVVLMAILAGRAGAAWPAVELKPDDRILILSPHPDDEVITSAGIIQEAVSRGLPVRVVFYTYGDNNEWSFVLYRKHPVVMPRAVQGMGLIRHDEAIRADAVLGLSSNDLVFLGYPDFGTLDIWEAHWGDQPAFQSMLTRVRAVPYANALRPGAPYKGEEILADLTSVIREFKPTRIFLSHAGDHNPDHRALHLFARVALWDLKGEVDPDLSPFLVHFKKWPEPRGYRPELDLVPPALFKDTVGWIEQRLGTNAIEVKEAALKQHASQFKSAVAYLQSFVRANELFGDFRPIALRRGAPPTSIPMDAQVLEEITPEELTDEERGSYIGLETRTVSLAANEVVFGMRLSRPLAHEVQFNLNVFGYRPGTPFAKMPKIRIKVGALGYWVVDQTRKLPLDSVRVSRNAREITIRVPLSLLGDPDRILTSARTALGEVPMDWVSWRILELQPAAAP